MATRVARGTPSRKEEAGGQVMESMNPGIGVPQACTTGDIIFDGHRAWVFTDDGWIPVSCPPYRLVYDTFFPLGLESWPDAHEMKFIDEEKAEVVHTRHREGRARSRWDS